MSTFNLPFEEGFRQFIRTTGMRYGNPYAAGSDERRQFQRGWQQAAMLCGQPELMDPIAFSVPSAAASGYQRGSL